MLLALSVSISEVAVKKTSCQKTSELS